MWTQNNNTLLSGSNSQEIRRTFGVVVQPQPQHRCGINSLLRKVQVGMGSFLLLSLLSARQLAGGVGTRFLRLGRRGRFLSIHLKSSYRIFSCRLVNLSSSFFFWLYYIIISLIHIIIKITQTEEEVATNYSLSLLPVQWCGSS